VIVLGLDGLEPKIVQSMLARQELPHLASIRVQGGYSPLDTTTPAQTPVAWSTFATGTNPGGHGIYDFIRRDPQTYLPDLALNRYEQKNAFVPPRAVNLRGGIPFWEVLFKHGIRATVLRCPCTYPPDELRGCMLAGMGVPDLRGGLGTSTFYSTASGIAAQEGEQVVQLSEAQGSITTHLIGPRNPKTRGDLHCEITLHVDRAHGQLTIHSSGEPRELQIPVGQWSPWLHVKFKLGLLSSIRGMVRFYLVRLEPHVELYASPINFDPAAPLFPLSAPPEYAGELADQVGDFYTTGMVEDHAGLNNGRLDEAAYLQQCDEVVAERERMMRFELSRLQEGLFYILFDTPDRLQHMFWRFLEPEHPANCGRDVAQYRHAIEEHYRRCDQIVGQALEACDDRTLLIVLSDHGFNSFQRGVHLNTWLCQQGLLTLQPGISPDHDAGEFFRRVDWSRTQAYALGLGSLYLNLRGRESQGIVAADQIAALQERIIHGLTGLRDPARNRTAIHGVATRAQLYRGPFAAQSPDLVVNFAAGYRVSWSTALGGFGSGCFENNVKRWSGDHIIDPALVPGVLFMNRAFRGPAHLVDLAPTILRSFGLEPLSQMEGKDLLACDS